MSQALQLLKTESHSSVGETLSCTKLVMPENLNPAGNLFGGDIMAWMDKASAMLAYRVAKGNVVTVSAKEISFIAPGHLGDQIEITARVNNVGRSSVKIGMDVVKHNPITEEKTPVAKSTEFVFVHIGEDGKSKEIKR